MSDSNELVIHFDPTRYRCQLCRERITERPQNPSKGWRKGIPLCEPCRDNIVIPGSARI